VRYLLDTNVVSELRKGTAANAGVREWFTAVSTSDLWLSVLVIGEIRHGIELIRRRDPSAASNLEHWLSRLTSGYGERILPIDTAVAEAWGRVGIPDPVAAVDGLLAATALAGDLTLVTRDTGHLESTGARLLNPFT